MRVALRRLFRLANPPVGPMSPDAAPERIEPPLQDHDAAHLAHHHRGGPAVRRPGAVAYHLSTQPTELTIAVGPPNSEDTRVVQSIAAQFAREQSNIRLQPRSSTAGRRTPRRPSITARPISPSSAATPECRRTARRSPSCARTSSCSSCRVRRSRPKPQRTAKGKARQKRKSCEGQGRQGQSGAKPPMRRRRSRQASKIDKIDRWSASVSA